MIYKFQILKKQSISSLEKHDELLRGLLTDPDTPLQATPLLPMALCGEEGSGDEGGEGVFPEKNKEGNVEERHDHIHGELAL